MIQLLGPGGAGKTTVGKALAARLGVPFCDLDEQFNSRVCDITAFLETHAYPTYSARNVQTYLEVLDSLRDEAVLALSSGFLTYSVDVHPAYRAACQSIIASPMTLVLLPSFDYENCVAETVRRQLARPFGRSAEREEHVIRTRFPLYRSLPARQFETSKPVNEVADELIRHLLPIIRLPSTPTMAS